MAPVDQQDKQLQENKEKKRERERMKDKERERERKKERQRHRKTVNAVKVRTLLARKHFIESGKECLKCYNCSSPCLPTTSNNPAAGRRLSWNGLNISEHKHPPPLGYLELKPSPG